MHDSPKQGFGERDPHGSLKSIMRFFLTLAVRPATFSTTGSRRWRLSAFMIKEYLERWSI